MECNDKYHLVVIGHDERAYRLYDNQRFLWELSARTRLMGYHEPSDNDPYVDDYAAALTLVLSGYPDKPLMRTQPGEPPSTMTSLYGYLTPSVRGYDRAPIWLPLILCVNVHWLVPENNRFDDDAERSVRAAIKSWMTTTPDHGCVIEPQIAYTVGTEPITYSEVIRFQTLRHMAAFRHVFPFPI